MFFEYMICIALMFATAIYTEVRIKRKNDYIEKVLEDHRNVSQAFIRRDKDYDVLMKILLDIYPVEELEKIIKSDKTKMSDDTDKFMKVLGEMIKKKGEDE